jgi:archaetidylinositol phosphate synthase
MANTWTHRIARAFVHPLVGTPVTPNHLTTLRLGVGLAAAAALALGSTTGDVWAGWLWLLSTLLDRADGELARLSNKCTAGGHLYDYVADVGVNATFFLALGVGQRHTWLGGWAILLGVASFASMIGACWIAEEFRKANPSGDKPLQSRWGFDPDDALYLLGPLCWLGPAVLAPCALLAALGSTGFMLSFLTRYLALRRDAAPRRPALR